MPPASDQAMLPIYDAVHSLPNLIPNCVTQSAAKLNIRKKQKKN